MHSHFGQRVARVGDKSFREGASNRIENGRERISGFGEMTVQCPPVESETACHLLDRAAAGRKQNFDQFLGAAEGIGGFRGGKRVEELASVRPE